MSPSTKSYKKHNSFVAIRQKKVVPDQRPRLEPFLGSSDPLLRQAAGELLGKTPAPKPFAPFQLHANVVEELSRLTDEELPRYLRYRLRYEVYPDRKLLDAYPPCIQIEPTSVCNFRCVFCYQTDETFTKKANGHMGMMTLGTFQKIVDEIEGKIEAVTLASRGEPLVCPDIDKMLAYARGKFLALKMNTNASLLTEAKCHAILSADISTLVFSADAAAEPQYSQLRVGGSLDKTLKNVRLFAEIKRKHYPKSRMITRVSGVKVEGSGDLDDMERFWGDFVDQVAFVNYNPWENAYDAAPTGVETPCSDLWRRLFVWWDGCANPCDVDFRSELAVGSAKKSSITELWRSSAYEKLRADHLEKRRSERFPCNRCAVV